MARTTRIPPPQLRPGGGGVAWRAPTVAVSAAIVAVYLATRLAFVDRFPYFFDEGTYGRFTYSASRAWEDIWISLTIGREPLQIWFGVPWVELGFSPLFSMRIVALLAGLLTLPILFLLGRRLANDWVGLAAAGLYALLPFFVVHNGIGIMESLVVLIMATALLLQIDFARRPSLRLALLLGLVVAAGVLTKENTKPALALIPVSLLCFDWRPSGRRQRLVRWLQGIAVVGVMALLADRLLRLSSYYDDFERLRASSFYTTRKVGDVLADPFASWGEAIDAYAPAFLEYVTVPLLVAFAAGAVLAFRRKPRLTLVLLAWFALPLVISLSFTTLPYPRHVMYLMPAALVLMAYAGVEGVRAVRRRVSGRAAVLVSAGLALVALAPALWLDARLLAHPDTGPYPGLDQEQYVEQGGSVWPPAADAIRSRARGERAVILNLTSVPDTLQLMLEPDRRDYVFVYGDSPLAASAGFAVVDRSNPFQDEKARAIVERGEFVPVERFRRPEGNEVVVLYERRG